MANFQVPENINFPAEEDKIGDYWKEIKAFQVLPSIEYDKLLILLIITFCLNAFQSHVFFLFHLSDVVEAVQRETKVHVLRWTSIRHRASALRSYSGGNHQRYTSPQHGIF